MTRFTCPDCGSHVAKELVLCDGLMQDVEYSGGELRYSEPETMGDILEVSYECAECGYKLEGVNGPDEFIAYCEGQDEDMEDDANEY